MPIQGLEPKFWIKICQLGGFRHISLLLFSMFAWKVMRSVRKLEGCTKSFELSYFQWFRYYYYMYIIYFKGWCINFVHVHLLFHVDANKGVFLNSFDFSVKRHAQNSSQVRLVKISDLFWKLKYIVSLLINKPILTCFKTNWRIQKSSISANE